jgi:hypothetical protein
MANPLTWARTDINLRAVEPPYRQPRSVEKRMTMWNDTGGPERSTTWHVALKEAIVRNRPERQKSALRRLTRVLALATLAVASIPATAALADASSTRQVTEIQTAPAAAWSLVGTVDPQHVNLGTAQMIIYGAFLFTPNQVRFTPETMPASLQQAIVPYARQPSAGTYTYKLVFHLHPSTMATRFRLDNRPPVDVAAGATTLEFITDTFSTKNESWNHWSLANADGDTWAFSSCDIYVQIT